MYRWGADPLKKEGTIFWRGRDDFPIEKHCGVNASITAVYSHLLSLILINAKYE